MLDELNKSKSSDEDYLLYNMTNKARVSKKPSIVYS